MGTVLLPLCMVGYRLYAEGMEMRGGTVQRLKAFARHVETTFECM